MELGVAASTVGHVPPDRLGALRGIMGETLSLLTDGRIVDIDVYARRNQEIHNAIIDLADNPILSDVYRDLGVGGLTTSLLRGGSEVGQDIADDHRAIVEAYEEANVDAALAMITHHNDNVKHTIRQAILADARRLQTLCPSSWPSVQTAQSSPSGRDAAYPPCRYYSPGLLHEGLLSVGWG
jgi:DNA-binding GntR family transcriptional regulator